MAQFHVESTFHKTATIHATSHGAALERYIVDAEQETGWSYPEESAISVCRGSDRRDYVCVDGFFERD